MLFARGQGVAQASRRREHFSRTDAVTDRRELRKQSEARRKDALGRHA
jgi:hypothetical protein